MACPQKILIICGEPSGDLHAGALAREILSLQPGVSIEGIGGEHLRSSGAHILHDIGELAVMGFFDVIKKLPSFIALKEMVLSQVKKYPPSAIILIDFSGFNLRLVKELPRDIPVFYYISPQVWASRAGRVKTIKKYIKKMLVLFKFEEEFYRRCHVPVAWVGHPLLDMVKPTMSRERFLQSSGLREGVTTIALLPGSRTKEIQGILGTMLEASRLIARKIARIQFVIAKSPNVKEKYYTDIIRKAAVESALIEGKAYDCIQAADVCLVASGTATLETAILEKPFLIIYKMNLLNYLLYKPQVKLPFIGMVNIVAGKKIVPEFIQFRARPRAIADHALSLLNNPSAYQQMKKELSGIKSALGEKGAARRAAEAIIDELKNEKVISH